MRPDPRGAPAVLVVLVTVLALVVGCVSITLPHEATPVLRGPEPPVLLTSPQSTPVRTPTAPARTPTPLPKPAGTPTPAAAIQPVTVGLLAPVTGPQAPLGLQARQGAELAATRVNGLGGILGRPLGVQIVDAGTGDLAPRLESQVREGVALSMLAVGSAQTLALVPAVRVQQVPSLYTATNPAVARQGVRWLLPLMPDEDRLARAAMSFARERRGAQRIAVLYTNDARGLGDFRAAQLELRDRYRSEVVAAIPVNPDGGNLASALGQLRAANPDATLVFLQGEALSATMRQSRQVPLPGTFVTMFDETVTTATIEGYPAEAEGWFAVTVPFPWMQETDLARQMVERYRAQYGTSPDLMAGLIYDATGITAEAIRRARSVEPDAVMAALRTIAAYDGVLGRYVYTGGFDGLQQIVVVRFEGRTVVRAGLP